MASRTSSNQWKHVRAKARRKAQREGLTHCPRCHQHLDYATPHKPNSAEADYIIPHALGGTDTLDNVRIICARCNNELGASVQALLRSRKRAQTNVQNVNHLDSW